jgi:hypothetical protein
VTLKSPDPGSAGLPLHLPWACFLAAMAAAAAGPWKMSTRVGCLQLTQVGNSFMETMQYIMHLEQVPISIGVLLSGLLSDVTHELGDDEPLPSLPPPPLSIPTPGGASRSCRSRCAPPLAPLLPAPPLLPFQLLARRTLHTGKIEILYRRRQIGPRLVNQTIDRCN